MKFFFAFTQFSNSFISRLLHNFKGYFFMLFGAVTKSTTAGYPDNNSGNE